MQMQKTATLDPPPTSEIRRRIRELRREALVLERLLIAAKERDKQTAKPKREAANG
jgi:hypothetical protein